MSRRYLTARDGLRARVSGPWTDKKLTYVERYSKAFMAAMGPKRSQGKWEELVYMDLLCGPGLCIDRNTEVEFDGSPLRALHVKPAFDKLYFSDLRPQNLNDLRKRIPAEDHARVKTKVGDCNIIVREFLSDISRRALGLVFLDPEGFEVKFETLKLLGARRLDILYLFPSGIGISRNLRAFANRPKSPMEPFWGGKDWRDLPPAKLAAGRHLSQEEALSLDLPWIMRFRSKVADLGFLYQDEGDPLFVNENQTPLYHLLFFSKDAAGLTIWRGIKRIEPGGQRTLLL